jgi:hypothetical protein
MPLIAVPKFERLFREAASLDVDKDDLKRHQDFVVKKTRDLLVVGQAAAKANNRDILQYRDLPITAGLQKTMDQFEKLDTELELRPILEQLATHSPEITLSAEAEERMPSVVGGLTVALARSFKIIDPEAHHPSTTHWERATHIFDLLL